MNSDGANLCIFCNSDVDPNDAGSRQIEVFVRRGTTQTSYCHTDCYAERIRQELEEHVSLGSHKSLSYYPTDGLMSMFGLSPHSYAQLAQARGHSSIIVSRAESYLENGAVYLYNEPILQEILDRNSDTLKSANYPVDAEGFVRAVAREQLRSDHPVMPVIRQAFGDAKPPSAA